MTIQNGHYSIQAGDQVMWYFEEEVEAGVFDRDGMRVRRKKASLKSKDSNIQYDKTVITKQQRKVRDHSYAERALLKRPAFIKPFLIGIHGLGATRSDKSRIIGVAVSNAGPYERVDIKISRMSH